MSSTRDIRDFYKTSNNKIPPFLTSASGSLNQAELHAISEEVKRMTKNRNCDCDCEKKVDQIF